jgi:hypothetical protein
MPHPVDALAPATAPGSSPSGRGTAPDRACPSPRCDASSAGSLALPGPCRVARRPRRTAAPWRSPRTGTAPAWDCRSGRCHWPRRRRSGWPSPPTAIPGACWPGCPPRHASAVSSACRPCAISQHDLAALLPGPAAPDPQLLLTQIDACTACLHPGPEQRGNGVPRQRHRRALGDQGLPQRAHCQCLIASSSSSSSASHRVRPARPSPGRTPGCRRVRATRRTVLRKRCAHPPG